MDRIATKLSMVAIFVVTIAGASATEIPTPEIHGIIALQYRGYFGNDDIEAGYVVPADEWFVRFATIELIGKLSEHIEYNLEMGMARCPASTTTSVRLMEAGFFFKPFDSLKIGMKKGHILRGFELHDRCLEILTAEKPRFATAFAPCHPVGGVILFDRDFAENMGLEAELALLNGPAGGTMDDEHDVNFGLIFRTPLPGLSIGGYYNDLSIDFDFDCTKQKANRSSFGFNYDHIGIHLQGMIMVANRPQCAHYERAMLLFELEPYMGEQVESAILKLNRL